MIYVNLLPPRFRKRDRSPARLITAMALIVAADAGLMSWVAWLRFGEAEAIETQRRLASESAESLAPQVAYFRKLESERKSYATREATLEMITSGRIGWAKKIDELIDVVNKGGEGDKYLIWFDDLTVSRVFDKRKNSAGLLRSTSHCGSDNLALVANFLDDLQRSPFIEGFGPPAPPEGSQSEVDETLMPSVVWTFPLELQLRVREEPPPPGKGGAGNAKAAKSTKAKAKASGEKDKPEGEKPQ